MYISIVRWTWNEGSVPKLIKRRLIKSHNLHSLLSYSIHFVASTKEEDFGLIRPSLIRQLRAILDQYPDDGQILKVRSIFIKVRGNEKILEKSWKKVLKGKVETLY